MLAMPAGTPGSSKYTLTSSTAGEELSYSPLDDLYVYGSTAGVTHLHKSTGTAKHRA